MDKISLYDRAVGDYKLGKRALADAYEDEVLCDLAGYLLQQSIEKLLKFQIELQGDEFDFTHSISKLIDQVKNEVPDWIVTNREKLTSYNTKTRYSSVRIASITDLKEFYCNLESYLEKVKPTIDFNADAEPKL